MFLIHQFQNSSTNSKTPNSRIRVFRNFPDLLRFQPSFFKSTLESNSPPSSTPSPASSCKKPQKIVKTPILQTLNSQQNFNSYLQHPKSLKPLLSTPPFPKKRISTLRIRKTRNNLPKKPETTQISHDLARARHGI